VSPYRHLKSEIDLISETLCFLVFRIPDDGQSPQTSDSGRKYFFLLKIFGYFHINTVRGKPRVLYDSVGQEHKQTLGYGNVKWLTLLPVFGRILRRYLSLKSFLCDKRPPLLSSGQSS
jgi:hypothetical protein